MANVLALMMMFMDERMRERGMLADSIFIGLDRPCIDTRAQQVPASDTKQKRRMPSVYFSRM